MEEKKIVAEKKLLIEKKPVGAVEKKTGSEQTEKEKLLSMSEISLWLDRYEDIFSDFDPRPYSQRALSDDFLYEAKRVSRDKHKGKMELILLIPTDIRKLSKEVMIKKRLKDHFKYYADSIKKDIRSVIKSGIIFTVFGIVLMFGASFILFNVEKHMLLNFLVILFEPASWFLFWEGLSMIIFEWKDKKPDLQFYKKMAHCEIRFVSY